MTSYPPKENKFHQLKYNQFEKQIEFETDTKIRQYFKDETTLELENLRVFHINHKLKQGLRTIRYNKSNGFTLLCLNFKNSEPLFQVAVCSENDTYSRLVGRVTVKERVLKGLKEKGLASLLHYPLSENTYNLFSYRYIANRYIKENLISISKKQTYGLPLSTVSEDTLKDLAYQRLVDDVKKDSESRNVTNAIDLESFKVFFHHIRYLKESSISPVLLGTVNHFRAVNSNPNDISASGGITLQAIRFNISNLEDDNKPNFVVITWANCSDKDVYSKQYGRKQCFQNIIKGRYAVYTVEGLEDTKQFDEYCIRYLETQINYPINLHLDTTVESES